MIKMIITKILFSKFERILKTFKETLAPIWSQFGPTLAQIWVQFRLSFKLASVRTLFKPDSDQV